MNSSSLSTAPRVTAKPRSPKNGQRILKEQNAKIIIPPILLVDDDSSVRESLRRVFVSEGLNVIAVATGEEALEFMQRETPSLVITDLRMAKIDGWDLLFHLRLEHPRLPLFVITALPLSETGGADRFASEYFEKPLDLPLLVTTAQCYLEGAKKRSESADFL